MHLLWLLRSSRPNEIFRSEGGREIVSTAFGLSWMEEPHMTWLTWLRSSTLAEFQELNTDPSKPPLQAGYPEHGKTEFLWLHWRDHFWRDEFSDFFFFRAEEKRSQTLLSFTKAIWIFKSHHFWHCPPRTVFLFFPLKVTDLCEVRIIDVPWLRPLLVWLFICSNEITHEIRMHAKKT